MFHGLWVECVLAVKINKTTEHASQVSTPQRLYLTPFDDDWTE